MYKFFLSLFFLNVLFCFNSSSKVAFDYSIKNIEYQHSIYSLKLVKSTSEALSFNLSWVPTNNLIIDINLNHSFESDNKIFYGVNTGLLFSYNKLFLLKKNIFGFGINVLDFDNEHSNMKWNTYFLINEHDIYGVIINTNLAYNFNQNFSFYNFSVYISKKLYNNFKIGLGINLSNLDDIINNIYFGIKYEI